MDAQEFDIFISLLKEIALYQLKIDEANGCIEIQKKEDKQAYNQLKKDLKLFYDKLDKAWLPAGRIAIDALKDVATFSLGNDCTVNLFHQYEKR